MLWVSISAVRFVLRQWFAPESGPPICALMSSMKSRALHRRRENWDGGRFLTPLANKDKREYGHRCDQQDGEHDGPDQRRKRSRLFVMVCHRPYSRRQLLANAAIAASRVGS